MSRKSWIEETFFKRECLKFIPSSRDLHRCFPACQVCQNLIRCHCGRLVGEHSLQASAPPPMSLCPGAPPPMSLCPGGPGHPEEEEWSMERHTQASPTDAYGTIDFQDIATFASRAKYVRVAVDSKPEAVLQLMLREWQMERPKLLITVQGGSENFPLSHKVQQAFGKGLVTAAQSTGAWILTDGINTGVSRYVGEAVKTYGTHDLRKRNTVGVTPWGVIDNNADLIGRDVFRPYQPLGNPLSKRACLNGFHSHFLLVDDGTVGKHGCQEGLRRRLERHIQMQRIHPRLNQGVAVVCVVVEGGPAMLSVVLDYVSSVPPVPVLVFEGSGRAADLLAFLHKQTAVERQLDADIEEFFLLRIGKVFGVEMAEASQLYRLLLGCMEHRHSITIFDSESEDQQTPESAILTTTLKGTKASPAEQLSMVLAWDRADIAKKHVLVYGQHWQVGSLEQAMLDALVMDRVGFVKLLIENSMTMSRFLTVARLEELYNTGPPDSFLHHLVEEAKRASLPRGYRLSLIDVGLVIEYLIGGAYRSIYTRKHFRAAYNRLHAQSKHQDRTGSVRRGMMSSSSDPMRSSSPQRLHFFRTALPYGRKERSAPPGGGVGDSKEATFSPDLSDASLHVQLNFNDLFVWAVLQRRQQMALFLWQHGEEALARATVACKLYRSMAHEARQSSMDDSTAENFKTYSLEFGQLAVDVLDGAFRHSQQMAMKLLTSEMKAWSHFTCLQMAVSSGQRAFVSHSCTQTLLTDLWTGSLNMRKNSFLKIILSLLLPPAILFVELKSQAEMCHVPQSRDHPRTRDTPSETHQETEHKDTERGLSCSDRGRILISGTVSSLTKQCVSSMRTVYEFYTAPVVKFWFHTMSYLAFLMLFSYTVLVKMEPQPSVQEWLVITYILSTAMEKIREVLMSEPRKLSHKLKVWFSEYWNVSEFLAILLFLAGLALRWHEQPYRRAGHIVYCLDIIFWFVRVLDLLAVNQHAGPYLTMITKMTRNMFFIVVMMAIVLLSFGVSRKSILSPDEEPSWALARDVLFQPYWMIFGEVYAGEIDACADDQPCPPGAFLTPFLQAVYLFFQYIIMVNILIAFFNNIYYDMASMANELWRYNRYRYIMTYQERPWLPPPFIILSHVSLAVSAIYRRLRGEEEEEQEAEQEERATGLKLILGVEDRKRLHEFEERCIETYFHHKHSLQSGHVNTIKATAQRAEEMAVMASEVSEKVHFIQDSLSLLDGHLGQLQDLSVLAVDTLALLSASDNLHHEEARLARCGSAVPPSHRYLPHSWVVQPPPHTASSDDASVRPVADAMTCRSTSPSLMRSHTPVASRGEWRPAGGPGPSEEEEEQPSSEACCEGCVVKEQTPGWESCVLSPPGSPLSHQTKTSMEEEDEEEVDEDGDEEAGEEEDDEDCDEEKIKELLDLEVSRSSSCMVLPSDPRCTSEGVVNPAFSLDNNSQPGSLRTHSSQWERSRKSPRWAWLSRDLPHGHCRSLSSSVENMAFSGHAPLSPVRLSFPLRVESFPSRRGLADDTSLRHSRSREWSKSSDFLGGRRSNNNQYKKTVKIQEYDLDTDSWSPSQSAWSSWARSPSRRSSLQSGMVPEAKSSAFASTDDLYPHYSAMERNNLMRLAHTIPFTPVSMLGGGEEVSVYTLEEGPPSCDPCSAEPGGSGPGSGGGPTAASSSSSWWSPRGLSALLRPLPGGGEEGSMDGGLRRGSRVLCTWAEGEALRPGLVYVVKAFRPEVVRSWQRHFHGSTALQLCLREIQQQRAAQRMMQVFNQVKPEDIHHAPRFLDVSLVLWHSDGHWLTIERNVEGDFRKYNNNTGEEIAPCCSLEETLLAFSHWTYEYSCRELLVLDIQGVGEELTDPSVIRAEDQSPGTSSSGGAEMLFGPDNLGHTAISSFLNKHSCNSCCHRLGLTELRGGAERRSQHSQEEEQEEEKRRKEAMDTGHN